MASLKQVTLPHGSIPTQMFGNVNLQNAIMYVNENFTELKDGVNAAVDATTEILSEKAEADHNHDGEYAALDHAHSIDSVIGLSSSLDGKADLNHEHSQYLSSLPSHYHDVNGISGLGEQLQKKAEIVHSHDMSEIEGLTTELGVKASAAYVDQQIKTIGETIKSIADNEIEDYASEIGVSGESESEDVPKDVTAEPKDESVSQKNARVGTAIRWARADHKHVFSSSMGENPIDNTNVSEGAEEESTLVFTDWEVGGENGLKLRLYGLVEEDSGSHILQPIDFEIASNGMVKSVSAPSGELGIFIGA